MDRLLACELLLRCEMETSPDVMDVLRLLLDLRDLGEMGDVALLELASDARIENLDTIGAPLEFLQPVINDPHELDNLADDPAHAGTLASLRAKSEARWNLALFDADVRASQARRLVVYDALRKGGYYPWDYQPLQRASERYMRNHLDLNDLEGSQRFPRGE